MQIAVEGFSGDDSHYYRSWWSSRHHFQSKFNKSRSSVTTRSQESNVEQWRSWDFINFTWAEDCRRPINCPKGVKGAITDWELSSSGNNKWTPSEVNRLKIKRGKDRWKEESDLWVIVHKEIYMKSIKFIKIAWISWKLALVLLNIVHQDSGELCEECFYLTRSCWCWCPFSRINNINIG